MEFCIGHNVSSEQEVESLMGQAEQAGTKVVRPAQPTFYGGCAGYLQDPDGHLWEVAFNPGFAALAWKRTVNTFIWNPGQIEAPSSGVAGCKIGRRSHGRGMFERASRCNPALTRPGSAAS